MIDFVEKISVRSESAYKIRKYLLTKLLILSKIRLYDVTNLSESVPELFLLGFSALSPEIWESVFKLFSC